MESKVLSFRVPGELLKKLDRLADSRYPNRKTSRTQVVLDAIELILDQEVSQNFKDQNEGFLYTVNEIVDKKAEELEEEILKKINKVLEEKIQKLEKKLTSKENKRDSSMSTSEDSVDESLFINLDKAYKLAQKRGYTGTKKSFSNEFTKHKDNLDYSKFGIKRIKTQPGQSSTFTDVQIVNWDL